MLNYTVILEDAGNTVQRLVVSNSTSITIEGLPEDLQYNYQIQAENQFGNSSSLATFDMLCKWIMFN